MEENKIIETEENESVEETMDQEFVEIDKSEMKKNYIIVGILYLVVIILTILLVIGIKNQKDVVKDNISDNKETVKKTETNINKNYSSNNIEKNRGLYEKE